MNLLCAVRIVQFSLFWSFSLQLSCRAVGLTIWQPNSVFTVESKQIKCWTELSCLKLRLMWTKLLPSVVCLA